MVCRSVLLVFAIASTVCGQAVVTEEALPTPLSGILDVDVFSGVNNSLHIVGMANARLGPPSYWDGYHQFFVTSRDSVGSLSTSLIPDTAGYWDDGLGSGESYLLTRSVAVDGQDNVILFWSKQEAVHSDIPPYNTLFYPTGRSVRLTSGGIVALFDLQGSLSPHVCAGPDNSIHFAWESIQSVGGEGNYVAYSSQVEYRYLSESGLLSEPVVVDTGFSPHVASNSSNYVHVAWLHGDSSSAEVFSLRYRTIHSGTLGPIRTFKQSLFRPDDFDMALDSAGVVHLIWTEVRFNQVKVFLLRYDGITASIDSSGGYPTWPVLLRMVVQPNGVVHTSWVGQGAMGDTVYYTNTRTSPSFGDVRARMYKDLLWVEEQSLVVNSVGSPRIIVGTASRMGYLLDTPFGLDTSFVPLTGILHSGSKHPVAIDPNDNVWVAYGKDAYWYQAMGLARFADQILDVDGGMYASRSYQLSQNFPNPFNPLSTISFSLPKQSHITLRVYDVLGREVAQLIDETKSVGSYSVEFNASSLPSGVYFYRLQAGESIQTKKMLVMK
jgi:hypothetical protein